MEASKRTPTIAEIDALLREMHHIVLDRYELRRALDADIVPAVVVSASPTSACEEPSEPEPELTKAEVAEIHRKYLEEQEAEERFYAENPQAWKEYLDSVEEDYRAWDAMNPGYLDALDDTHDFQNPDQTRDEWRAGLARNDLTPVMRFLDSVLAERGFALPHESVAYRQIALKVLRIGANALDGIDEAFLQPHWQARGDRSQLPTSSMALPPAQTSLGLPKLTNAIARFKAVKNQSDWGSKSARDADVAFRFMCDFFGDIGMEDIRKADARDFKLALSRVPSHHGKSPFVEQRRIQVPVDPKKPAHKNRARFNYAPIALQRLIDMADDIEAGIESGSENSERYDNKPWVKDGAVDRLSFKTQNKYITYAHGLFNFVLEEADLVARNPFDNLLHSKAAVEREQGEGRQAWPKEALEALFRSPVWTGCLSENRRSVAGNVQIRDDKFWVPLLGALAGMRLEEACQLRVENVIEIEGLPCIAVRRGAGQRVKNTDSIREIPIHRTLLEIGFLDFVGGMKNNGEEWLFPSLEPAGPHKVRGYTFSKWFTEYRRSVELYEPWLDFHALRHSFVTNLKLLRQPVDQIEALVGHTRKGMTSRVYFKGFVANQINDTVQALDYGIDLRHLIQVR